MNHSLIEIINNCRCFADIKEYNILCVPCFLFVVSLIIFLCRLYCIKQGGSIEIRKINKIWLLYSSMFLVWSFGFGLYMDALIHNSSSCKETLLEHSITELIFRSAVESLGLFTFGIESNIIDNAKDIPCVKGLISLSSFIAGTLTILVILQLLRTRLWESLKTWWGSIRASGDELCIFFGINEATRLLADSINNDSKDRKFRLVLVEFPIVSEDDIYSGLGGFVKTITHRVNTYRVAKSLHARLSFAHANPNNIKLKSDSTSINVFQEMGLNEVARMIRKTNEKVHLFFLSENEEYNIQSVSILMRDATILEKTKSYKCKFYCHIRNSSVHRVIENNVSRSGIEIKAVDSSRLSIDLLKYKKEYHPVNYVDIQDDGTVSSPFKALVVGFGEIGLDAVRFLYEFGAFVKTGSSVNNIVRSDFHCDVVDKNMQNLAGQFVANAPAIKPSMSFKDGSKDNAALITLHDMDCQSVDFYQRLEEWIQHLNYVVVATDNDELNISLAVRIFRLAIRHETNFEHFRILVRVRHDENQHFQQIVQYYNRLWAAEMKKDENEEYKRQKTVLVTDNIDSPLSLFGKVEDIYKYEYIVSDDLLNHAMKFKERYDLSLEELQKQSDEEVSRAMTWDDEIKTYLQLDSDYEHYSPTFSNVMKLRRMQSQNYENSFHVDTKLRIAKCALGEDEFKALISHQLFRNNNEVIYHWKPGIKPKEKITKVLDTLAQTEHLRWNASHEILGYQNYGDETFKDEARLYHGCIKEWDKLSDRIKSYDYNVVDVSLGIIELKGTK